MTREEIATIDAHCQAQGLYKTAYLKSKGLKYDYYDSRKRYLREETIRSQDSITTTIPTPDDGGFVPVEFTRDSKPPLSRPKSTRSQCKQDKELANGNALLIEMRTPSGTELRIQGQINIKMLKEIIHASGGGSQDV